MIAAKRTPYPRPTGTQPQRCDAIPHTATVRTHERQYAPEDRRTFKDLQRIRTRLRPG